MNRYEHESGGTNEAKPGSDLDRRLAAHPGWSLVKPVPRKPKSATAKDDAV